MTRFPTELRILIFEWLFTFFQTQLDVANLRANSLPLYVLGAEIDVPYPCSHWLGQTVPSFDPKRATALWPSTFHELMVVTLFRVTAYQVDVEELPAFPPNRTLHRDVAPACYVRHLRIMADSEAFTSEGEANYNFRPRPSELLVENLRHLAHILASTWDGRENFLTIYVVLPQHIVAASIFVEQRLKHVVVVVAREVINLLAALQAKLGAPKWLFHIKLEFATRRPIRPACD
jgi:hypothetical protein